MGDGANRQSLGINAVAAAGDNAVAGFDFFVNHHVIENQVAGGGPLYDSMQTRFFQQGAYSAAAVIQHQHLRHKWKYIAHLTHDAIGSDDRHIRFQAGTSAAVNIEHARLLGTARTYDLGGDGLDDKMLLEIKQRLQAASLSGLFAKLGLADTELLILLAQLAVLTPQAADVDVVVPVFAEKISRPHKDSLQRRDDR